MRYVAGTPLLYCTSGLEYCAMGASPIKFGTSGWRGLIADDFTFANVRLAVKAIADHVQRPYAELDDSGGLRSAILLRRVLQLAVDI